MVLTVAAIGLGPATAGAEPKPTAKELKRQLAELEKKVDKLILTYNGKRVALQKAQRAERKARERLRDAEEAYQAAARQVSDMVSLRYQSNGLALPNAFLGQNPADAAVLEHLATQRTAALAGYAKARDEREQVEDLHPGGAAERQHRDRRAHSGVRALGDQQHRPLREPIGDQPAVHAEQQYRQELARHRDPHRRRRTGQLQHEPVERDALDPVPGAGDGVSGQVDAVRAQP